MKVEEIIVEWGHAIKPELVEAALAGQGVPTNGIHAI